MPGAQFTAKEFALGGTLYTSRVTGRNYLYSREADDHVVVGVDLLIYTDSRHRAMDLIEKSDSQIQVSR